MIDDLIPESHRAMFEREKARLQNLMHVNATAAFITLTDAYEQASKERDQWRTRMVSIQDQNKTLLRQVDAQQKQIAGLLGEVAALKIRMDKASDYVKGLKNNNS